ncbi:MAG: ABC transporter permease subunit [Actinomycetota bacterium]
MDELRPSEGKPTEPNAGERRAGERRARRRPFWIALGLLAGLLVYAYGFSVTDVNLDQIRSETRRQGLVRIMRALARPELIEYDQAETATDVAVMVPCDESPLGGGSTDGRRLVMTPGCAEPRAMVTVEGFGLSPNQDIRLYFIPASQVELRLGEVRTDGSGNFTTEVRLPSRPDVVAQTIRAVSTEPVGEPRFTQTAGDTLEKIIETVFLALIATTFATLLAIPLSFFAARNLMKDITSPLVNVSLALIAAPLGVALGVLAARGAEGVAATLAGNAIATALGLMLVPAFSSWLVRRSLPPDETVRPNVATRLTRAGLLVIAGLGGILVLYLAADLLQIGGTWSSDILGVFGFLGSFFATVGELLEFGIVVITAIFGSGLLVVVANRAGHALRRHLSNGAIRLLNVPLAMVAGAVATVLFARGVAWFYEWTDPVRTLWIPAVAGAMIGLLFMLRSIRRDTIRSGLGIYYASRTIFNVLRAIEPLIMAIVFVVWVGIGPFAGALALALHTIAALAKLYSEQVESIAPGPLEAVRATGANRLQNVVYAVVPQIIPPYISFTMYRWDINVRMSTIIGFVGGGGIGFLLQQNINLLNYRAAAAQIVAIAVVVAAMDWLSSRIRERYV